MTKRAHRTSLHPTLPRVPPGSAPGTLLIEAGPKPKLFLIDYCEDKVVERELSSVDEIVAYLEDDVSSITWIDVRGITDRASFERLGEIFKIHPLALEDVVNIPQRPHADVYPNQQLLITRMVQMTPAGELEGEQLAILFGKGYVLTIQEEPERDCLDPVRERIRKGRGNIRVAGSDYLAYALLDAVIDGFFPVLETLGERLEDLEVEVTERYEGMPQKVHVLKRELLLLRRAIWPQRDLLNALVRDDSPHISKETRVYLRDPYDHAVQVMDMVETFREITSGLMDLYMSGVSNRMNEIMKVLTIISTIFLPMTFIAGVYGMNFDTAASPYNMPELKWRYGYPMALALMAISVIGLLVFYRRKGWLGRN
ncbi:MAG: magnesium/cobalt transporter CorA [Polyangiaceae bacterium]